MVSMCFIPLHLFQSSHYNEPVFGNRRLLATTTVQTGRINLHSPSLFPSGPITPISPGDCGKALRVDEEEESIPISLCCLISPHCPDFTVLLPEKFHLICPISPRQIPSPLFPFVFAGEAEREMESETETGQGYYCNTGLTGPFGSFLL